MYSQLLKNIPKNLCDAKQKIKCNRKYTKICDAQKLDKWIPLISDELGCWCLPSCHF